MHATGWRAAGGDPVYIIYCALDPGINRTCKSNLDNQLLSIVYKSGPLISLNHKRGLFSNQRVSSSIYLELFNVSQSITSLYISKIHIEAVITSMTNIMCCSTEGIIVL